MKTQCVLIGIGLTLITGCDRKEIQSYRVAREVENTPDSQDNAAQAHESGADGVTWSIPTSWKELPTTSAMRIATFQASNGQEIAVTAFPGDVGGLVENVNRWRGQVGLEPVDEQSVNDGIEQVPGVNVLVVDASGTSSRLLGTIIDIQDGQTWFAKAIGSSESIDQIKSDLIAFSASFQIHDHDHDHDPEVTQTESNPEPTAQSNGGIDWTPPEEWKVEENSSSVISVAFNADSGARITLTSLGGTGGGALSNINRWRNQLGLPFIDALTDESIVDLGDEALFVDLVSPDDSARMAAGILPIGDQTLFFKLTGPVESIEEEFERFKVFIDAFRAGKAGAPL